MTTTTMTPPPPVTYSTEALAYKTYDTTAAIKVDDEDTCFEIPAPDNSKRKRIGTAFPMWQVKRQAGQIIYGAER
jgi:hypothetical protein